MPMLAWIDQQSAFAPVVIISLSSLTYDTADNPLPFLIKIHT